MGIDYYIINLSDDLSSLVRSARKEQGLSQTELAQRSQTSQRFVSEFERGKESAEVGKVLQLLQALGLRIAVTSSHTVEESRKIVEDGIARITREVSENARPRPRKRLVDYLAEG